MWMFETLKQALKDGTLKEATVAMARGLCDKCGYKLPNHSAHCEHATIDDVRRGVTQAEGASAHYRKVIDRHLSASAFWQAKFHTVKHENNKLRRKLGLVPPSASLTLDLIDAANAVILNWEEGDLAGAVNEMREVLEFMEAIDEVQPSEMAELYDDEGNLITHGGLIDEEETAKEETSG